MIIDEERVLRQGWTETTFIHTFLVAGGPQQDTIQPSTEPQIDATAANIARSAINRYKTDSISVIYKENNMLSSRPM